MPDQTPEQAEPAQSAEPGKSSEPAGPAESVMDEESNFPRGLAIRLFAYLVAGHVLAGFLYLLFEAGAKSR